MRAVPLLLLSAAIASACMPGRQVVEDARAESPAPPRLSGSVLDAADVVRRAAPHGKAHVTELAAGQNAWLGILELAADVRVPEHRDPTEETIHVLEGTGTITIDGRSWEVGPGDTIFMPADALVTYANGPAPMRAVQVFAGPGPASKYDDWAPEAAALPTKGE